MEKIDKFGHILRYSSTLNEMKPRFLRASQRLKQNFRMKPSAVVSWPDYQITYK